MGKKYARQDQEEPPTLSALLDMGYVGCSLALILSSETLLLARNATTLPLLILLVGTQILLCLALWAIEHRHSFLDRISPLWTCILFLFGTLWSLALPLAFDGQPHAALLTVPAACTFGLGNSINVHQLLDYCRLTMQTRFASVSLGACALAAVLNLAICYAFQDAAYILCGGLTVGWYLLSRRSSRRCATQLPAPSSQTKNPRRFFVAMVAGAALSLACGIIPAATFNGTNGLTSSEGISLLALALTALALVLMLAALAGKTGRSVLRLAATFTPLAATGLVFLPARNALLLPFAAALSLLCPLVVACATLYLFAHLIDNPREHPARFWGMQVVTLIATVAGTAMGIMLREPLGTLQVMVPSFISTYFLLVFVACFQRAWTEPQVPNQSAASIEPNTTIKNRCEQLSRDSRLTQRESDVLQLIARGWTVDMAARRLVVSPGTVRTHLKHLYVKLDVHSREELLVTIGVGAEEQATGKEKRVVSKNHE